MKFLKFLLVPAFLGLVLVAGCKKPEPKLDMTTPKNTGEKFQTGQKTEEGNVIPPNMSVEGQKPITADTER